MRFWRVCSTRSTRRSAGRSTFATSHGRARRRAAAAVVDALEGDAPFRYLRLREPPYDEADLRGWADRLRPLLADGIEVYAYFKHEDEPTAPGYALRLLELLAANNAD